MLAIVLAACGSDSDSKGSGDTTTTAASGSGKVPNGGTLTVGAEQEPDCADWIASCAGASWGLYTIAGAHDAPDVRLREEERRVDRGPEHPPHG